MLVPEMALDMIEVGESSGALSPMLTSVGRVLRRGSQLAIVCARIHHRARPADFHGIVGCLYSDFAVFANLFFLNDGSA